MASLRPYRPSDEAALYEICLLTGDAGADATHLYRDPKLVGEMYAAPYGSYAPDLCLVAEDDAGVGGFVVGVADTRGFETWMENTWLPPRRALYPEPLSQRGAWGDQEIVAHEIHHPPTAPVAIVETHPAHLHLNLLPRLQGRGLGRGLFEAWLNAARGSGVEAAHLNVFKANTRGQAFWRAMGFTPLAAAPADADPLFWGRRL